MLARQTILLEEDEEAPTDTTISKGMTELGVVVENPEQAKPVDNPQSDPETRTLNFDDEDLQFAGFSGRPNKIADTCYCFWNTGALAVRLP